MATQDDTEQGGLYQQQHSMITQSYPTTMGPQQGMMMVPMDPHRGECRGNAKIVAYVTIVFNVLYLTLAFVFVVILVFSIAGFGDASKNGLFGHINGIIVLLLLLFFLLSLIFAAIELWTAWGLAEAADFSIRQDKAIKKATCWRCYHIFLVILNILTGGGFIIMDDANGNHFIIGFGGYSFVLFLLRLLCIYIVHNFIQELRRVGGPMMLGGMGAMAYASNQYQHQQQPYQYQQQPYQYQHQPYQYQQQPYQYQQQTYQYSQEQRDERENES